jgi:hypothetical protein
MTFKIPFLAILATGLHTGWAPAIAQTDSTAKPVLQAIFVDHPITLTGKLDDPLWNRAVPVELTYEVEPGENIPAPQKTFVMAMFDRENLYFGFRCLDSHPREIRSHVTERDRIFEDDFVIVILDTYNDYQRAYELAVNPHGIPADLMRTLSNEDDSFDMIWESAAAINDSGWTAELAIPFKSLRFPQKGEQEWTIHLDRIYPRISRSQLSWTKYDRNNPSLLSQGGILRGLHDIEPGGTLELLPYVIAQEAGERLEGPPTSFLNHPVQGRVGGGIQYSPGPNFSLDAVINPDFSQVESDADQISVNTTFALSYPEKRPFFLIGQELLQTPMYYSRSINNPLGAARLIGKTGGWSYLYMAAYDRDTPFDIPGEEESDTFGSTLKSFSNIGRLRYDFGDETYAGGMAMTRNFEGGHNYVAGLDWRYKFWKNWSFSGEGFLSHTRELNDPSLFTSDRTFGTSHITAGFDGEQYSGNGIHLELSRSAREYSFEVVANSFSPTYQAYNGLFSLTNYRQLFMEHSFTLYPQQSFLDRVQLNLNGDVQFNYAGVRKESFLEPGAALTMKGQTRLEVSYLLVNNERFRGVSFTDIHRFIAEFTARPIDAISFEMDGQVGRFIYRTETPTLGVGHRFSTSITLRPTTRLKLDVSYSRSRLSAEGEGPLFYDGYIVRTVASYHFTEPLFLRIIAQFNSFESSFNLYPLLSYKLNAFTICYAGITNDYLNEGSGMVTTARQFFLKLQYLWRS